MKASTDYQRRLTKSLNFRLVFFVCAFLLIAKGLFSFMMTRFERDELIAEVVNGSRRFSEGIKRSTRYAMLKFDREAMHQILEQVGQQENVERVRIFNKEGDIIISTHPEEIGHRVDTQTEACYGCHEVDKPLEKLPMSRRWRIFGKSGERRVGIVDPIYNEPDCWNAPCHVHPEDKKVLGVLDVVVSLKEVDEMLATSTGRRVIFTIIAIIIVGTVISYYLYRTVTLPVRRLLKGTEQVTAGDLDYQIPSTDSTEIGYLAQSFNKMARTLREQQQQVVQQEKLASLGQMAAGIVHEINNPLSGILVYVRLMLKKIKNKSLDPEDAATNLTKMEREVHRCSRIIRNLLDFSRQTTPQLRRVDMAQVIEEALLVLGHQASLQNIEVVKEYAPGAPTVEADFDQMRQVLNNMFTNSMQAMKDGGKITLRLSRAKHGVLPGAEQVLKVQIEDTGCGISPENLNELFTPFFTTKEKGEGVGLGLAVVYGIIQRHNGRIEVSSKAGKGTTFAIYLRARQ
jgi:two-component system NtrC family sensor kinase